MFAKTALKLRVILFTDRWTEKHHTESGNYLADDGKNSHFRIYNCSINWIMDK